LVLDEAALLDPVFIMDEELRKLHQVKVKTAKLEIVAEADRRCTVLTCREEPLGVSLYLLYSYKSTNTDTNGAAD
jgi:hypothetical protein